MAQLIYTETHIVDIPEPEIDQLITEDDTPVDNIPSAKNQRLLVETLYTAKPFQVPFLADANIGLYASPKAPAIVPDVLVSLDVTLAEDWWAKKHRSYFVWEFGKPPDVVIEIVSNLVGEETGTKLQRYAALGINYYVIYDPQLLVQEQPLQVYELHVGEYLPRPDDRLPRINLTLTLWDGLYEEKHDQWLRWCDADGNLLLTGNERAEQERVRAEQEHERAEQERLRAERLAAKLRELGIDPDAV
jgi:Uma2 family endonuclease